MDFKTILPGEELLEVQKLGSGFGNPKNSKILSKNNKLKTQNAFKPPTTLRVVHHSQILLSVDRARP